MPRKCPPILIYEGDDFARLGVLRREIAVAERRALTDLDTARFGDAAEPEYVTEAKAAYAAFVTKAAKRAEEWVLEPIGHQEFRDLLADHPPRKIPPDLDALPAGETVVVPPMVTHPDDEGWGFNTATFGRALLLFVDEEDPEIRTVVSPDLDEAALKRRVKRLASGEYRTLWTAAYLLNEGEIADPKSEIYSATVPRSAAT